MDQTPLFDDRRRWPRYEVTIPAEAAVLGSAEKPAVKFERAMVRNVSREGLMLTSEGDELSPDVMLSDILARGRPCQISCKIPGGDRVSVLSTTIRWAGCFRSPGRVEYRIGSRLEDEEVSDTRSLAELVSLLETDSEGGDLPSDSEPLA